MSSKIENDVFVFIYLSTGKILLYIVIKYNKNAKDDDIGTW